MRLRFAACAAAIGFVMVPPPVWAAETDFTHCDGHAPPRVKKKIKPGEILHVSGGGTATGPAEGQFGFGFGVASAEACARALTDPLLRPEFWRRRATLLQARGIHEFAAGNHKASLATLDEADALFAEKETSETTARSFRLINDAVRAHVLFSTGDDAGARALLDAIEKSRPYSPGIHRMTGLIRLSASKDAAAQLMSLRTQVPGNPMMLRLMIVLAMQTGAFADAVAYADQISFDLPRQRGGWAVEGVSQRPYENIADRAYFAGARAYALLALGRTKESAEALARGRTEAEDAAQPAVPDAKGQISKRAREDYLKRRETADRGIEILEDWGRAIALRIKAPTMTLADFDGATDLPRTDGQVVAVDILSQIKPRGAQEAAAHADLIRMVRGNLEKSLSDSLEITLPSIVKAMPLVELDTLKVKMHRQAPTFWAGGLNGFNVSDASDPALINIRFGTEFGTPALLEEAAALAAANHVASLGKDAFVVESTQMIKRTTHVSGMYIGSYERDSGYEYRLLIRPLSAAEVEASAAGWRALRVEEIRAALAAKFPVAK